LFVYAAGAERLFLLKKEMMAMFSVHGNTRVKEDVATL